MSVRKNINYQLGNKIIGYRKRLNDLPKTRQGFIENRSQLFFGSGEWISEKSLANYENGRNIPSLEMVKKLAVAFEVDEVQFVTDLLSCL
ncbi:helix-turn-helix domain-containing protein [Streptococcus suis]|nr:helix-turn-helix transcriptional regulator [Streptococcus suis]